MSDLSGRSGYATATTCKVMVASLYSGDVTVTCNGQNYSVAMTAVGTGRATPITFNGAATTTAGYAGSVTITGLSSNQAYSWSATQGSRSCSGTLRSAPAATDNFTLFFGTCSNAGSDGLFAYMKNYAQNGGLPLAAIVMIDDYDYLAAITVDDSAGTGHVGTGAPGATPTNYNYALGYLGQLGLLTDTTQSYQRSWNGAVRSWLTQNVNWLFQWGDWEVYNDIGWQYATDAQAQAALPYALTAFNIFWGATNPPTAQNRDTTAIPWAGTIGPVRIVAVDGNTRGNTIGSGSPGANLPANRGGGDATNTGMTILGNNQIDDALDALNTSDTFKLLLMMHSVRALVDYTTVAITNTACGANHPMFDAAPAEYKRLFTQTGNTPKSVMDNANTNGTSGKILVLNGDYHLGLALRNAAAAYAGNAAESFVSLNPGTITGSNTINQVNSSIREGLTYNGSTVEYLEGNGSYATGKGNWHIVQIDVYGSQSPKEMHVKMLDKSGNPVWRGVFVDGVNGNLPANRPPMMSM